MENIHAYIDGQNLHLGTRGTEKAKQNGWAIDNYKFRRYLHDKYGVKEAYYFLGFVSEDEQELYDHLQKAGFILVFREHSAALKGKKKGNVDCDIVFSIMKKLVKKEPLDKVILVSGDGDYKKLVDFLVKENKFKKILFPNKEFASSLYKKLGSEFYDFLDADDIKSKIALK